MESYSESLFLQLHFVGSCVYVYQYFRCPIKVFDPLDLTFVQSCRYGSGWTQSRFQLEFQRRTSTITPQIIKKWKEKETEGTPPDAYEASIAFIPRLGKVMTATKNCRSKSLININSKTPQ